MPTIGYFDRIKVLKYYEKGSKHHKMHVHISYSGESCVIDIDSLSILEGSLPSTQLRKVKSWIEENYNELSKMWVTGNFYNLSK